jgi:hypothetical protein
VTHIPDCDKESVRGGKEFTICGALISLRKMVTANPTCPQCRELDSASGESVLLGIRTIWEWSQVQTDRWGFILSGKFQHRKRWRK